MSFISLFCVLQVFVLCPPSGLCSVSSFRSSPNSQNQIMAIEGMLSMSRGSRDSSLFAPLSRGVCKLQRPARDEEEQLMADCYQDGEYSEWLGLQACHFSGVSLISGKSEVPFHFQGNSCSFSEKDMWVYPKIVPQKSFLGSRLHQIDF